eukprot:CAMPEP_0194032960 /NCGR_PEP_ID=MMETSP0009_2-20130614/5790_1 /TAXON_ID=210454 /ORGANISM="Grammatophora oceanica, Strain CCMP 410" /LENGTH=192 /DNA_ID=CAMNT_0038673551 /DNA_START=247 /DNA_END=825 /DNA_ORIENTATION=-
MSEEAKTADSDYVHMEHATPGGPGAGIKLSDTLNDPNLTQEEKDMRLALALQQQENAAAYDAHKKKHTQAIQAQTNRTSRSGAHSKLAAIRDKDHGMLKVPAEYTTENAYVSEGKMSDYTPPVGPSPGATPQEVADHNVAVQLQKIEQVSAGTTQTLNHMLDEDKAELEAARLRSGRSNAHVVKKGKKPASS